MSLHDKSFSAIGHSRKKAIKTEFEKSKHIISRNIMSLNIDTLVLLLTQICSLLCEDLGVAMVAF